MSDTEMSARIMAHYRLTKPRRGGRDDAEWSTEAKVDRSRKRK